MLQLPTGKALSFTLDMGEAGVQVWRATDEVARNQNERHGRPAKPKPKPLRLSMISNQSTMLQSQRHMASPPLTGNCSC